MLFVKETRGVFSFITFQMKNTNRKNTIRYDKKRSLKIILGSVSAIAIPRFVLSGEPDSLNAYLSSLIGAMIALGLATPSINVLTSAYLVRVCDKDKLGKANSLIDGRAMGLTPIASFLVCYVLNDLGSSPLLFICASYIAVTISFIGKSPAIKRL